jgi:hypothetical protein
VHINIIKNKEIAVKHKASQLVPFATLKVSGMQHIIGITSILYLRRLALNPRLHLQDRTGQADTWPHWICRLFWCSTSGNTEVTVLTAFACGNQTAWAISTIYSLIPQHSTVAPTWIELKLKLI